MQPLALEPQQYLTSRNFGLCDLYTIHHQSHQAGRKFEKSVFVYGQLDHTSATQKFVRKFSMRELKSVCRVLALQLQSGG
jgi:hypothetical protein